MVTFSSMRPTLAVNAARGKAGRGSENKKPFIVAVSLNEHGHPMYMKLALVNGFTSQAIGEWAKLNLAPAGRVMSDGLGCFAAVAEAGRIHTPFVISSLKLRDLPQLVGVNTVLGNLTSTQAGALHSMKHHKNADYCFAAYAHRFDRRFDLRGLVAHFIVNVAGCVPVKKPSLGKQTQSSRFDHSWSIGHIGRRKCRYGNSRRFIRRLPGVSA